MNPLRVMRSPSLLLRVGVMAAVITIGIGAALAVATRKAVTERAVESAEQAALMGVQLGLAAALADGQDDATSTDIAQRTFRAAARNGVQRVIVYDTDRRVIMSDDASLVGTVDTESTQLGEALGGRVVSEIELPEELTDAHLEDAMLEIYVPVEDGRNGSTLAVLQMYTPYAPIAARIQEDVREQWTILGVGLVVLFSLLFHTVAEASKSLRRQAQRDKWMAGHDELTGLPNRTLFLDLTEDATARARRSGETVSVLLVDLDRFKEVNDTLGHEVGDGLLERVAARLESIVRDGDTVGRLAGDEFAVLVTHTEGPSGALKVAARFLNSFSAPFDVDGVLLEIGASIGVACYPEHSPDPSELLQRADVAMHRAKSALRGDVTLYDPSFDEHSPEQLALYGELRRGIEDELVLHYQPKVALDTGRVVAVEALVRWQNPGRGLMFPDQFIGIAEQTGLIRPLTERVLDLALAQVAEWAHEGLQLGVSVNVSARSLIDDGLAQQVLQALQRHGLPPSVLELELTESSMMQDPGRALKVLHGLRSAGIAISVDDYGTGHSSLAYLRSLPVSRLKIDKSFVMEMATASEDEVIVRSTIELARNLGLAVVAEGVENQAALDMLRDLGCDAAQGFYLSRPCPAENISAAMLGAELLAGGTVEVKMSA